MWNDASLMQQEEEEERIANDCSSVPIINNGPSSLRINNKSTRITPLGLSGEGSNGENDVKIAVEEDGKNEENFNPEAWLPITESRKGNLYYCIFHLISSGIGVQSLALPFAFVTLGWAWGIMLLSIVFIWQLYTLWLLVRLHESDSGRRYSRYIQLAMSAFGPKLGKVLALFPVLYLSGGTCVMLLITGGNAMKKLHHILNEGLNWHTKSLTTIEWYLIFICLAIAIAQLPNLNTVAWVSLVSAITALVYCSVIWTVSVGEGKNSSSGFGHVFKGPETGVSSLTAVMSAVGVICFSFRGHNVVLEIQGTLPASPKSPIYKRMWRGVTVSYAVIALCLFPMAIGGFWAYRTSMPKAGLLNAFTQFHTNHSSTFWLAIINFFLIINSLCSFQIYAMLVFDNLELRYISITKKPCTFCIRTGLRLFFGGVAFFISVALPFLPQLSPLLGGIALPVTFAYPCFMWISIKKPKPFGTMWWINLVLGCLGVLLSIALVIAAIMDLVTEGISANFFHPKP